MITSGKGGVGKTTVCANVGVFLSKIGYRVALLDLDFGLNNLDVVLGLEKEVVFDLNDVLSGRCRPKQALIKDKYRPNLYVLPSDSIKSYSGISGQNIKLIVESLEPSFDYIFLDCPAGIDVGFHRAVAAVNEAFVVTTPSITSLRDADKVISILETYKLDFTGLIINRVRGDLILGNKMMLPQDIGSLLKTEILGILPEEDEIFLNFGKDLPRKSDSKKAYALLAENIAENKRRIFDATKKYTGFWGSIRKGLKGSL